MGTKQQNTATKATAPTAAPVATPPVAAAPVLAAPVQRQNFGVSPHTQTRPFFAGQAIATAGHANGVGANVLSFINSNYGAVNHNETKFAARNAWHAIRGWCAVMGINPATGKPLPTAKK